MSQQSIDSVRQTEQFGPIVADADRDRKAALTVADYALTQDDPEDFAREVLAMLGLLPNEPPPARKESLHGTDQLYKAGCRCVACKQAHTNVVRQRRYRENHGGGR